MTDRPHGIITVASGKGGSGKTTSALAIAGALKKLGVAPDAVMDLDYGASLTRSYGYTPSEGFSEALLDGRIGFADALHDTNEGIPLIPASATLAAVEKGRMHAWRDRLRELGCTAQYPLEAGITDYVTRYLVPERHLDPAVAEAATANDAVPNSSAAAAS